MEDSRPSKGSKSSQNSSRLAGLRVRVAAGDRTGAVRVASCKEGRGRWEGNVGTTIV